MSAKNQKKRAGAAAGQGAPAAGRGSPAAGRGAPAVQIVPLVNLLKIPAQYKLLEDCWQVFLDHQNATKANWGNIALKKIEAVVLPNHKVMLEYAGRVSKNKYRNFSRSLKTLALHLCDTPYHAIRDEAKITALKFLKAWKDKEDMSPVDLATKLASLEDKIDTVIDWLAGPGPFCEALCEKLYLQGQFPDLGEDHQDMEPDAEAAEVSHDEAAHVSNDEEEGEEEEKEGTDASCIQSDEASSASSAVDEENAKSNHSDEEDETPCVESNLAVPVLSDHCVISYIEELEIGRCLGKGGFAYVFLARHKKRKALVALKVVLSVDEQVRQMVRDEARIQRGLNHQNVVRLLGNFLNPDGMFLVLEYARGKDLIHILNQTENGFLPPGRTAKYVAQISEGLAYIHSKGIIHRDIRPDNLLMFHNDTLKIADFGIAVEAKLCPCNEAPGVPEYQAPEMLDGVIEIDDVKYYNKRIDDWALGIVTCVMLTGCEPFEEHDEFTIQDVIKSKPPDWKRCREAIENSADTGALQCVDECFERLISKLLAKKPEKRIHSKDVVKTSWIISVLQGCE